MRWKVIEGLLLALMLASGLSASLLWNWYADHLPAGRDAARGRVIELNTHGRVVNMTRSEQGRLQLIEGLAVAFLGAAIWVDATRRPFREKP